MKKEEIYDDPIIARFLMYLSQLSEKMEKGISYGKIRDIYLFGSRCRDDWRSDSDYDILIVLERKDRVTINSLYDIVMDILLDTGRLISLKIFTEAEFNRLRSIHTPFMESVIKEGIRLDASN